MTAEPVPAGSDVSPGTYTCTSCGYELEVGSTNDAASATQIPALAALHTTSKRPTPSKRKSAQTSSTPPVWRNLSSLIRRSQTSASTKAEPSRGPRDGRRGLLLRLALGERRAGSPPPRELRRGKAGRGPRRPAGSFRRGRSPCSVSSRPSAASSTIATCWSLGSRRHRAMSIWTSSVSRPDAGSRRWSRGRCSRASSRRTEPRLVLEVADEVWDSPRLAQRATACPSQNVYADRASLHPV